MGWVLSWGKEIYFGVLGARAEQGDSNAGVNGNNSDGSNSDDDGDDSFDSKGRDFEQ